MIKPLTALALAASVLAGCASPPAPSPQAQAEVAVEPTAAPTPEQREAAAQEYYAREKRQVAAIEAALGSRAFLTKDRDALAAEMDLPELQLTSFPEQSVRVWQLGPFHEPHGGTLRWMHAWAQWWGPDGEPQWSRLSGHRWTQWRTTVVGADRLLIGAGYSLDYPASIAAAWRLPADGPSQPAPEPFAGLGPDLNGIAKATPIEQGLTFTAAGSVDGAGVQFAAPGSADLKVCTSGDSCVILTWNGSTYKAP